jgi:hypothetical protein
MNNLAKDFGGESSFVTCTRGLVRPIVTMLLTVACITLLIMLASSSATIDKAVTIFLAVYGPILGFWFGQQTALKTTKTATKPR